MFVVNCPACAAQYQLNEAKIGAAGRKLKCAKCGHLWLVLKPVMEEVREEGADEAVLATMQKAMVDEQAADEERAAAVQDEAGGEVEDRSGAENKVEIAVLAEVGRRPWWAWLRGPRLWRGLGWLMIVSGLVAGGWMVWRGMGPVEVEHSAEDMVVEAPLAAAAPRVVPAPEGVVLQGVRAEFSGAGSGASSGVILTVSGRVKNVGEVSVTLPKLQVELLSRDGSVTDVWPVRFEDMQLAPAANLGWEVSFTNPPVKELGGWRAVFVE